MLEEMGDHAQAAVVAATLATCLPHGERDEVLQLTERARRDAAPDDVEAQVRLWLAEAHLAAAVGDPVTAQGTAQEAVRIASGTDSPVLQADASFGLARALLQADQQADAAAAARAAEERYARKGHLVGVRRAARLRDLSATGAPRVGDPR